MINHVLALLMIFTSSNLCLVQDASQDHVDYARQRAESKLYEMNDQVKSIKEPMLRIFFKLKLVTLLWNDKYRSTSSLAPELLVIEALDDLKAHESKMPAMYVKSFRAELLGLVQLYAPALFADIGKQSKTKVNDDSDQLDVAHSLLGKNGGVTSAVETVRHILNNKNNKSDLKGSLFFFLFKLEKEQPTEFLSLLAEILSVAEQNPGRISVESLFWLKMFYLRDNSSAQLKARFIDTAVGTIEAGLNHPDQDQSYSYQLLSFLSFMVRNSQPSLYIRINNLMAALNGSIPKKTRDWMDLQSRIEQSSDPLNELMREADLSNDSSIKQELLIQAAQLAKSKGQLKLAVELADKIEKNRLLWRDQFLSEIVDQGIQTKDPDFAYSVACKIDSISSRTNAIRKVVAYLSKSNDVGRARELLNSAVTQINSSKNSMEKIRSLLFVAAAFIKIDEGLVIETTQAAIKVSNDILRTKPEDSRESEARKSYDQSMIEIASGLIPLFRYIAAGDEFRAYGLASDFQNKEMSAAAIFGACSGILARDKEVKSKEQNNQRN